MSCNPRLDTVPANGAEWLERWNDLPTDKKIEAAEWIMRSGDMADQCRIAAHAQRIEALEAQIKTAEGWWSERFAAGMRSMEPDIKWRDEQITELKAQIADLTLWRDAVLAAAANPDSPQT